MQILVLLDSCVDEEKSDLMHLEISELVFFLGEKTILFSYQKKGVKIQEDSMYEIHPRDKHARY